MEEASLSSIKYRFDIAKNKLSILISIINSMYIRSVENKHFELFDEALKEIKLHSFSRVDIESLVSDANLFLNEEERIRLFKLCKKEYMSFTSQFNNVCESYKDAKNLSKQDSAQLEKIYYKNCIGIIDLPLYGEFSRRAMIDGVQKLFIRFGKEIMKLDIPEYVEYESYKETILKLFRSDLNDAQSEDKLAIKEHPHEMTVVYSQHMTDKELLSIDYCEFFRVLKNGEISAKHLYKYLEHCIEKKQIGRLFKEYKYFMNNRMSQLIQIMNAVENEDYRGMIVDGRDYTSVNDNTNIENQQMYNKQSQEPQTLAELFRAKNYEEYMDVLVNIVPQLLDKIDGKYIFVGCPKTQRGLVAAYFKLLKSKNIIHTSTNRVTLAKVMSSEIIKYRISPASIDNTSGYWEHSLSSEVEKMLKSITLETKSISTN